MSTYEKKTKHIELGMVYIKKDDAGNSKKFMTFKLGSESLIANLEEITDKLDRLKSSGHMGDKEYNEQIEKLQKSGAKYRIMLRVDQ